MRRKEFLKKGLTAGVGAALIAGACTPKEDYAIEAPNIITNKKFKWKMVTTWPTDFPVVGIGCNRLADWVRTMSAGRLDIQVYGAGQLAPALQVFEAVSSGAAEMGHGASYYWAGIEAAFQFFTSVPFGMNAQQMNAWMDFGGGLELWTDLYADYNLVPFHAGNTGVQMGGWFNKKIESMDSWKGLKMRMPGLGGKVLERAGGTAVLSPGGELYTNLERGVIDALEWIGPYHDYLVSFHQIAKYYYFPGWHESGSVLECMVNKREFDKLPKDLQEILRTATYRSNQYMLSEFESKNNAYLKRIKAESDVEILQYPLEVLEGLKKISYDIYEELAASDPLSKKIYTSFWNFKKDISEWNSLSEKLFFNGIM